jgi:ankyrin repeat protein
MFERELPAHPSIEQYKKQAKDLARDCRLGDPHSLARMARNHPRFHKLSVAGQRSQPVSLTDAQLVLAREYGFQSWPRFARHIETDTLIRSLADLADPVSAFIEVACVPRHCGHASGTLELAEMILARYPRVAKANIYTAAILADEDAVQSFLSRDPKSATAKGGPHEWDALTHLCFSRYLRLDKTRSEAFVRTARALLDAGASANTGWVEIMGQPNPKPVRESVIYGASSVARHPELTQLLLDRGADPNDGETPYHLPESYDNAVLKLVMESGKLNSASLSWMLVRKADWHDYEGMKLVLEYGADPNLMTIFGNNALHHALRRDNRLAMIELLLDHGADPALTSNRDGKSAVQIAARRGRGDVLVLLDRRGMPLDLKGVDRLIAASAKAGRETISSLTTSEPGLVKELLAIGGTLLAEFAGNGNAEGIRCLLDLGVDPGELHTEGDPYFDVTKSSTALHVAAWRAWPAAVKELIERGAPVNALDGKGRTALALAVRACVDSYWTERRSPDSVAALLAAGALLSGIQLPSGYDEVDQLLRRYAGQTAPDSILIRPSSVS